MNGLADERKGATDDYFVANACWLWTLRIMADAAAILGNDEDAALYRELREKTLAAFRDEYVTKTGRLVSETQTAMTLALREWHDYGGSHRARKHDGRADPAGEGRNPHPRQRRLPLRIRDRDPTRAGPLYDGDPAARDARASGGAFPANVAEGMLAMANGQPLQGLKKMGGK